MATYSEAYLHYAVPRQRAGTLEEVARRAFNAADAASAEYFRDVDIDIVVRVEEASRKIWVTFDTAPVFIVRLHNLRTGLDDLVRAATNAAEFVITRIRRDGGIRRDDVIRRERRRGLPGKLKHLFESVADGMLSPAEATDKAMKLICVAGAAEHDLLALEPRFLREFRSEPTDLFPGKRPKRLRRRSNEPIQRVIPAGNPGIRVTRHPESGQIDIQTY